MKYVGVDLHKQVISVCVVIQEDNKRKVVARRNLRSKEEDTIESFFAELTPFQVVVEATASYEWFVSLVEPLADRVLLAHPKKLRVIAESTRKTDNLDAQILAEFLALDMIPEAHRPPPRVREHRVLVRYRTYLQRRRSALKTKLRGILTRYNADVKNLFTKKGREYLATVELSDAHRFAVEQLVESLDHYTRQLSAADKKLSEFAKKAPIAEREAREVLDTMPCVGPVTIDVVVSELGDVRRFGSQKKVAAYAGLDPGIRESANHSKQLGITKAGSRMLRWALVELAWRMVGKTRRWGLIYHKMKRRTGAKKAIVAVARRLLCVMVSMLKSGQRYSMATEILGGGR